MLVVQLGIPELLFFIILINPLAVKLYDCFCKNQGVLQTIPIHTVAISKLLPTKFFLFRRKYYVLKCSKRVHYNP